MQSEEDSEPVTLRLTEVIEKDLTIDDCYVDLKKDP